MSANFADTYSRRLYEARRLWEVVSGAWAGQWLTSTRAGVGSSYNDEATGPELQNTAETASEPSETSSSPEPKSEDQEEDVGQGAPRARGREGLGAFYTCQTSGCPPRARARGLDQLVQGLIWRVPHARAGESGLVLLGRLPLPGAPPRAGERSCRASI